MRVDVRAPAAPYSLLSHYQLEDMRKKDRRTVVVFGIPRGGTTMMAGVVQRCGIWIGDGLPGNLEDPDFVKQDTAHMVAAIKARDAKRKIWGFKYPAAGRFLADLHNELTNPFYIVVWRDVMAAGMRELRGGEVSLAEALHRKHRLQAQNLQFARSIAAPFLFVSYERAISHPLELAQATADFVGGHMPKDQDEYISFMEPESYKPVKVFSEAGA